MNFKTRVIGNSRQFENVNFGWRDSKGRAMGADVKRHKVMVFRLADDAPATECEFSRDLKESGYHYAARVYATRDGAMFYGGTANVRYFRKEKDRETYIKKRLESLRSQARKKADVRFFIS